MRLFNWSIKITGCGKKDIIEKIRAFEWPIDIKKYLGSFVTWYHTEHTEYFKFEISAVLYRKCFLPPIFKLSLKCFVPLQIMCQNVSYPSGKPKKCFKPRLKTLRPVMQIKK